MAAAASAFTKESVAALGPAVDDHDYDGCVRQASAQGRSSGGVGSGSGRAASGGGAASGSGGGACGGMFAFAGMFKVAGLRKGKPGFKAPGRAQ